MSKCDVPAILEEVSKILRVISDVVKNPADSSRPIPSGWVVLGPAKLQPRKPGDKHWSIAAGEWVDTPDDAIEYANLDDWRAIRKVDEDADKSSVAKLVEGLAKAMQNDSDLAWTWHCNIAVGSLDEGVCHETANLAAARFMSTAFGVDVTTFDEWKSSELPSVEYLAKLQVGDLVRVIEPSNPLFSMEGYIIQTDFGAGSDPYKFESEDKKNRGWLNAASLRKLRDSWVEAPADHIPEATKMVNTSETSDSSSRKPIAIPAGWRELEPDEVPLATDMHEWMGGWYYRNDDGGREYKWHSSRHIRKIETANPSVTPNSSTWIPNVGDKVRVNCPGRIANGKVGVILEVPICEYSVHIESEKLTSFNLQAKDLEPIEASNCPVIPDSSAGELLVDTAVKFNDGSGTVPGLSGWTVEPDAYIGCLSVFPVPHGWTIICPEAKTEPRVIGDRFYRITKGQWEELTEANVEQANKQNWTAIRKIPSVVVDQSELLGSKPQYRDPTAADIGKTIEVRSEYCTLWEERELVSICNEEIDNRFVCRHENDPKRLKLWSNARIKVQEHIL